MPHTELTNQQLTQLQADTPNLVVLDVRTPDEYTGLGHIPQAQLFPLHQLPAMVGQLQADAPTVLICQHGVRSMNATLWLQQQGFTQLYNLTNGMSQWDGDLAHDAVTA
jgi:rhodanese-related sulfurtransferase